VPSEARDVDLAAVMDYQVVVASASRYGTGRVIAKTFAEEFQ